MQEVKINNTKIKSPHELKFGFYNLTKHGRVASGLMTMDFIAAKRKLDFSYKVLSGTDFTTIMGLINTSTMFFTVNYYENNVAKSGTFYVGEIGANQFRTDGVGYVTDVTFNLIEQ